ncbi:CDP-diacylglycerol--glycerol-3-phosphate 3-phosphatidyltransferase [Helicobacter bilis]|uniref:CDP-diacylglycerol--glycerol-3-phosphate 3-phosphatidyltransferase n=1 Tax=Helicobacter bilis TaxID=37372 RepID=UPI0026EC8E0C|nr:CDP-diacylglycerol--glycerol-3-phosphate 3-phosphatidyltransferase [Helicobacter bilis]MCI7411049.1 CDP-diacylglycerol--glycerol-3-phosphate 3-phosphatidyltransferase [Helicobacter bilis]MDD7296738.1 CDP-diacylglycerol--glycerol-3-phosphate 3-phosphatidyltransferase [Helicobacter bilis]MDY4400865.1 CDP-diacylglycerol--glycerol-3-phosphate 3-phosphatidyltransferase [Helicobacter bilis]
MKHIPNILTCSRILLAVLLLAVLLHWEHIVPSWVDISWRNYCACLIFCIASITDFFDGYIARQFDLGSTFGEVFDPLADKMLILGAFIGLLLLDRANAWAVFIILSREFYITGLRVVAANSKQNVAASPLGKYKTGFQILAIAFLLADFFPGGTLFLWIAVIVTLYSGLDYTFKYYKAMA